MIGAVIIPYIFPLMLGRTFDLNTMRVGVDIFPKEALENTKISPTTNTYSKFGRIQTQQERKNLMGVSDPFSTYIKSGLLNAGVTGEYVSDIIDDVDIVSTVKSQMVIETLDYKAEPLPNWKDFGEALGTHYVDQVIYGGDITSSMRFNIKHFDNRQQIIDVVNHRVFELGNKDLDEHLKDILKSVESSQFKILSSIPLSNVPNDMESLTKTNSGGFRRDMEQFRKGNGLPVQVILRPLRLLDSSRNGTADERMLNYFSEINSFDEYFDDLRDTKALVSQWMKDIEKPLTEEQEQKVADFCNSLEDMSKLFYEVLDKLGTPQGPEQLKKAQDAYKTGEYVVYRSLAKKYLRLRKEIEKEQEEAAKTLN